MLLKKDVGAWAILQVWVLKKWGTWVTGTTTTAILFLHTLYIFKCISSQNNNRISVENKVKTISETNMFSSTFCLVSRWNLWIYHINDPQVWSSYDTIMYDNQSEMRIILNYHHHSLPLMVRSPGQHLKQGNPDLPLPSHIAFGCHPAIRAPFGPSHRGWAHGKGDPHFPFRLSDGNSLFEPPDWKTLCTT